MCGVISVEWLVCFMCVWLLACGFVINTQIYVQLPPILSWISIAFGSQSISSCSISQVADPNYLFLKMDNDYPKAPELKDLTVGTLVANYGKTNNTKNVTMLGGASTKDLQKGTIGTMLLHSGETNNTEGLTLGGTNAVTQKSITNEQESYCLGDKGGGKDRGLVLVLSYENFENKNDTRHGNSKDVREIINTFDDQEFKVIVQQDKTEKETLDILDKASKNQEYKMYNCFVLIILSHGEANGFFCIDGKMITYEKMYDYFHQKECPFVGKPKLFFIQACRGGGYDHGLDLKGDAPSVMLTDEIRESLKPNPNIIPKTADTFTFFSGYNGYQTFRLPRSGTWFIQTLCSMINDYGDKEELMDICRRVGETVSGREGKDEHGEVYKQIPKVETNLFKKFYFFK